VACVEVLAARQLRTTEVQYYLFNVVQQNELQYCCGCHETHRSKAKIKKAQNAKQTEENVFYACEELIRYDNMY